MLRVSSQARSTVTSAAKIDTPMTPFEALHDEAALTFSGSRLLTADEVAQAVVFALDHHRLEVLVPAYRGWLSKLACVFPWLSMQLMPGLQARGLRNRRRRRGLV